MGCDIHIFCEKRENGKWISFENARMEGSSLTAFEIDNSPWKSEGGHSFFTGGRHYQLFGELAGVRGYSPSPLSKNRGIPKDSDPYIKDIITAWEEDAHSHGYCTLREIQDFPWSDDCRYFLEDMTEKMTVFTDNPDDIRLVFCFDN